MSEVLGFDLRRALPDGDIVLEGEIPLSGITAVSGPSGAGKTSLLRAIAGLEPDTRGTVRLGSEVLQDGTRFVPPHQRNIGVVFQEPRLFPHMNVASNIRFGARLRGVDEAHVRRVVDLLGLEKLEGRSVRTLSGGEARRVALARTLAARPRLLLLDEPLTGLDSARKAALMAPFARAIAALALPTLLVTHAQGEILALADRVLGVDERRITGWLPPPHCLTAEVVRAGDGGTEPAVVELAGRRFALATDVPEGRRCTLVVAQEAALLSSADPGATRAVVTLPVRYAADTPDGVRLQLDGQALDWRGQAPIGAALGQTLSLTLLKVWTRP